MKRLWRRWSSGQEYLNNLPEGEGNVSAVHFTEMGSATTKYASDYTGFYVDNDYIGCLLLRSEKINILKQVIQFPQIYNSKYILNKF
jgi:hypothetical protein